MIRARKRRFTFICLLVSLTLAFWFPHPHEAEATVHSVVETFANGNNDLTSSWRAPAEVTSVLAEVWGGGGGGGGAMGNPGTGGGGSGGSYARATVGVTPLSAYSVFVGSGGSGSTGTSGGAQHGTNGSSSWFSSTDTVLAGGGVRGLGTTGNNANGAAGTGEAATSVGDQTYLGGDGSQGVHTSGSGYSGAGGGGAGSTENGGNASAGTAGGGGSNGGGAGANGVGNNSAGNAGNAAGGGGSGAKANNATNRHGGSGARGWARLSYDYDFPAGFPVVKAISSARSPAGNSSSFSVSLPEGVVSGDLILVVMSSDGNPTMTGSGTGWTKMGQSSQSTNVTGAVFWKFSDGDDALTVTTSAAEQTTHVVYLFSNVSGNPTGTSASAASTNSDAPNLDTGVTNNYAWLATRSSDSTNLSSASPSDYDFWQSIPASGTGGASTETAIRYLNASSEDPGNYTNTSVSWVGWTIAIPGYPLPDVPSTPTFDNITVTTMDIGWTTATGADTYKIERCDGADCSDWEELDDNIVTTSYSDSDLSPNTLYRYRLRASNSVGDSDYSSVSEQYTLPATAGDPNYDNTTATSTEVNWSTPSNGAAGYQLAECHSGGCRLLSVGLNSTTTEGLSGNTAYSYAARAENTAGSGAWSATTTVLTLPSAPDTPTFEDVTITTLTVNWDAPSGGADTYKIERCDGADCSDWEELDGGVATATYDDSVLTPETLYRYRLRASNATGDSMYSPIAEITTESAPVATERIVRLRPGVRLIGGTRLR